MDNGSWINIGRVEICRARDGMPTDEVDLVLR